MVKGRHHRRDTKERGTHLRVSSDEHDEIAHVTLTIRDARRDNDKTVKAERPYMCSICIGNSFRAIVKKWSSRR
jgi:hypothetical protein